MKPPRLGWGAGLALLLVLLLLLAGVFIRPTRPPSVRLPDGREFTLLNVSCGTQHRYRHGPPLAKVVAPLLTRPWEARVGLRTFGWSSATPTMVFWVLWHDPRETNAPSYAAVFDGEGHSSEPVWISQYPSLPSGDKVVLWTFANYPHSASTVGIRIFNTPKFGESIEFKTRHPAPSAPPVWTNAPLPSTQHSGNLSCTLLNLTAGKAGTVWRGSFGDFHANWNTALFHVTEREAPTQVWQVAAIQGEEATGNVCDTKTTVVNTLGDYQIVEFDGALWGGELPWKLHVELTRAADFTPDELWSIRGLPVPEPLRPPLRTNVQATVKGLNLVALELERPFGIPNPFDRFQRNAEVRLETALANPGTRVTLVRAIDDQGRMVLHRPGHSVSRTAHVYELKLAPGVTNVDFTFAIHHSQFLEFVAKPKERPSPPAPTGR